MNKLTVYSLILEERGEEPSIYLGASKEECADKAARANCMPRR